MNPNSVPKTLALIPDGNRRWAKKHSLSIFNGYNHGVDRFIEFSKWCWTYGVDNISVWMLSEDNLRRPKHELDTLFKIYKKMTTDKKLLRDLHENGVRVVVVGRKNLLPKDLAASFTKLETATRHHKEKVLNMLLAYGGKDDILCAAKYAAKKFNETKNIAFEKLFEQSLLSYCVPNVDLIIRTSGEQRLSGFIPWQSNYSELYFSKKLWPDFTKADLKRALSDYSQRQRRFGK